MFFELLNIKTPAWYKAFISGRRLTGMSHHASVKWYVLPMTPTVYRKSGQVSESNTNDTDVQQRQPEPLRLTDQYIALLVLIFTKAGLLEVGY
jgi:rapamycin-insensitive companion of mTOR